MRSLFVLIYIFIVATVSAQKSSTNSKAQKAFELASKHLQYKQIDLATDHLKKAIKEDPTFATAFQQLGDIYRKQEKYRLATLAYQKVLDLDSKLTPLTYFGIGESQLFTGNYQQAMDALENYKTLLSPQSKSIHLVNKYISDCTFSLQHLSDTSIYLLNKLPKEINSQFDEYFPQLTADKKILIFTRKENNQENFYESNLIDNKWSEAKKLIGDINSEQFNEGAHCISPDGKYLFFTGCNRPDGIGSCDIYVSKKENGKWSIPHNLGAPINTKGWEAQPSISADGKTLYFVSNRAGGYGGYDLYKSHLTSNGQWSLPVNLGPTINTSYNESAPFIHADNHTLYFSSDGWPGFGKNDIFKSTLDSIGKWSIPQNLGNQINDFEEQMSMHVSINGRIAHLATQDSTGNFNIYSLQLPTKVRPQRVAYIIGSVVDASTKKPLQAIISVTNVANQQVVFRSLSDGADGQYLATLPIGHNYAVHVQKEGYLFDSKQYDLKNESTADEEFFNSTLLSPILLDRFTTLNNIYFDVNKYDLLPHSVSELAVLIQFLMINDHVSIEIGGHTDNTGNKQSNQILSENRAKAVVEYLIGQGISPLRLQAVGYGDSRPASSNMTDSDRQQNRRTDFKIIKLQ